MEAETAEIQKVNCAQCGIGFTPEPDNEPAADGPYKGRRLCCQCRNRVAAGKGCGICGGAVRTPPSGDPFSSGPHKGRYWCPDCWTLHWDEHPSDLADNESQEFVAAEARKIRLKRTHEARLKERHGMAPGKDSEVLFEEGESRVFLTERGTLLLSLACDGNLGPDEYDPDRFRLLIRAVRAVVGKMPGYEEAIKPA